MSAETHRSIIMRVASLLEVLWTAMRHISPHFFINGMRETPNYTDHGASDIPDEGLQP